MTRINLISPTMLCDQHLLAEYRELPRIVNKVLKNISLGKPINTIKDDKGYRLGTGHVTFFNDKCMFLVDRFDNIYHELKRRGFELNFHGWPDHQLNILREHESQRLDYIPIRAEKFLNLVRISNRMPDKPRFFKVVVEDAGALK